MRDTGAYRHFRGTLTDGFEVSIIKGHGTYSTIGDEPTSEVAFWREGGEMVAHPAFEAGREFFDGDLYGFVPDSIIIDFLRSLSVKIIENTALALEA